MKLKRRKADPNDIRVLLVDDCEVSQVTTKRLLKRFGILIDIASDGHEALNKLTRKAYRLMLIDVHMPEMDGLITTKLVRSNPDGAFENLKIVALTGSVADLEIRACYEAGMDDYISKPIDLDKLYSKIMQFAYH